MEVCSLSNLSVFLSLSISSDAAEFYRRNSDHYFFYLITPALTLLVGPLLYFFVRSLVHEVELTARQKWIHLIPMLAVVPFTGYTQSVIALGTVSQLTYLLLSFQLLNRYHIASMAVRSDADSMKLTWIVKALAAFTVLVVIDLVRLNLQTQPHISIDLKMAWYFTDTVLFSLCFCIFIVQSYQ